VMKVSEAIEALRQSYNPDDEICISWWGRELFPDADDNPCTDEKWQRAVKNFDTDEAYQTINARVWDYLNYAVNEAGDF